MATLVDGILNAGRHDVAFDASSLSSGLYLYKLQVASMEMSRRMMVLK